MHRHDMMNKEVSGFRRYRDFLASIPFTEIIDTF